MSSLEQSGARVRSSARENEWQKKGGLLDSTKIGMRSRTKSATKAQKLSKVGHFWKPGAAISQSSAHAMFYWEKICFCCGSFLWN
jgi:hypothetical protein